MEDDVEPALILEKVAKASASKFNFKERSDPVENITPVVSISLKLILLFIQILIMFDEVCLINIFFFII